MSLYETLISVGEPFAAGLFELKTEAPIPRYANALKRFYEHTSMEPYDGGMLYPCGVHPFNLNPHMAFIPHYANTYVKDMGRIERLKAKTEEGYQAVYEEVSKVSDFPTPHVVGGAGWTHCFPNYKRILEEGIEGYEERVKALPQGDFKEGMLITLESIFVYHNRCMELLRSAGAAQELIDALAYTPYHPPRNVYEAMVAWNFIYYLDGCDDIGPLDKYLLTYHQGEDLVPLIREFFKHVDANDGWSGTLGPEYNEITLMCIRAIHNGRRPNLQLLVKPDMPDQVWEEVYASLSTSCGQPAMYNYELYRKTLCELMPDIPKEDLDRLAFGGCTETMLEGISAVGSDDAGINTALVFDQWMRKGLTSCQSFDIFLEGLKEELRKVITQTLDILLEHRRTRAKYRPHVIRTLFVDDCLDKQLDLHNDGARYTWSVINVAGLINVIDSLNVIRTLIYQEKKYTGEEFLVKLDAREPEFLLQAKACPNYGNDNDEADLLGQELVHVIADAFGQRECFPSGKFYPVSNQFTTYADAGKIVHATPDGRCDGAPLCDSMGAIHGNDNQGPTALLGSVSKLPLHRIIGTPITNIRISKDHMPVLKSLVLAYFEKGGMQLQVSCLSRDQILDAMAHPDKYESLVVRIGGFSEYFNRLSPELKQTVLDRTEY